MFEKISPKFYTYSSFNVGIAAEEIISGMNIEISFGTHLYIT